MNESIDTPNRSPWHRGEKAMQESVGVAARMEGIGQRVIRDQLIEQHREFYPLLPFVVLGAVDAQGDPWATLRAGKPGFLRSPDPATLHVAMAREDADPAERGMDDGDAIGLLGMQLQTRRRNRLNGTIRRVDAASFDIGVAQSYGNCPQYIQLRTPSFIRDPAQVSSVPRQMMERLDARARELIGKADTFFVASYFDGDDGTRQVDVSHRGGKAGFVRVDENGVLTVPDFSGNLFFNTLGNMSVNRKAGLVFADFESGDLLQLSGSVEILLDSPEIATFQGAERLWRFTPRRVVYRPAALPLRLSFEANGWSPNSLMTGSWEESASRTRALALAANWREFRVTRIVDESSVIRSILLAPTDGAGLIPHLAGQHLPIRLRLPGTDAPLHRTYTLSVAPSDGVYRLSVRKQGPASAFLHGLAVGDVIEARAPAGSFTLDATERRPAVLMAAGIGVTPMIAMLRHIVYEGLRSRRMRSSWLFYAARSKAERAFDDEIEALVRSARGAVHVVRVLSDTTDALDGRDYEAAGRLDVDVLRESLPFDDYDFYLCGPAGFMQATYDGLRGLNIADDRVHAEAFGPAAMQRSLPVAPAAMPAGPPPATVPVPVAFLASGKEARWTPGSGSLLELAESRGLDPPFSCRSGSCGSCATRVAAGAVAYTSEPAFKVPQGQALICCSVPAADAAGQPSRLHLDL